MLDPNHDAFAARRASRAGWLGRVVMLIAWVALALQLGLALQAAQAGGRSITSGLVAYFGYFTI